MNIFDFISLYKSELLSLVVGMILSFVVILVLIGRCSFKRYMKELIKMFSGEPSFFSKKRIESGIAFWFAFWMTIFYLKKNPNMDIWAFGYILTSWMFISGYVISAIQNEKKLNGGGKNIEAKSPTE